MKEIKLDVYLANSNELELVSDDVKKVFENKNYLLGAPTMAQLSIDIRNLIEELKLIRISIQEKNK